MEHDEARERREESRFAANFRLFVHVQSCEQMPDFVGKSIVCEAIDLSRSGLQISAEVKIPTGTILSITIGTGRPFAMYLLQGVVRWQSDDEQESRIGVQLLDRDGSDFRQWQDSFEDLLAWIEYLESPEL